CRLYPLGERLQRENAAYPCFAGFSAPNGSDGRTKRGELHGFVRLPLAAVQRRQSRKRGSAPFAKLASHGTGGASMVSRSRSSRRGGGSPGISLSRNAPFLYPLSIR